MKKIFTLVIFMALNQLNYSSEPLFSQMLQESPFVISKDKVEALMLELDITKDELLVRLVPFAKQFAKPVISNYQVGIAGLGESGNVYLGVNLEFADLPLNSCIHGEQFLVTLARLKGERKLEAIALSAAPCGHCRQFMHEMGVSDDLRILTPASEDTTLAKLLPEAFGPNDLGLKALMMEKGRIIKGEHECIEKLSMDAACHAYAPYTLSKAGVALLTKQNEVYLGSSIENAAFNPSVSPLHAALIMMISDGRNYEDIEKVALAERACSKIKYKAFCKSLLKSIAPQASLEVHEF